MRIVTTAVAAGALGLTGLGVTAGAAADPAAPLRGTYSLFSDHSQRTLNGIAIPYGNSSALWNISPCGADCAHIESATGWSADAHLVNGRWEFTREGQWTCPDGRNLPNYISYSIDATTLTGTSSGRIPAGCEGFPVNADGIAVTLTRV